MPVGGDDDTVASSLPTLDGSTTLATDGSELVGGRYRIIRWLGGGGMGRVYEALDTELGEHVALKVLKAGLSDDALERFRREVKLTRRIQHRNVCRMFDIGEHAGEKFLTMELVAGEPLTRRMSSQPTPWLELEDLAKQICAGLVAAHEAGVVHRDLKPDNVLVERDTGRAVLTDFGIARGGDDPSVTQIGAVVGTPRYMSPEQLAGRDVDVRADLFSFGVMLFELATATRPWSGDNAISIAVAQATASARTIDTQSSAVPAWFAALVAACIELDPDLRPPSAAAVLHSLDSQLPPLRVRRDTPVPGNPTVKPGAARVKAPTGAPRVPATPAHAEPTAVTVLPFSCAPGDEYLADGLLEDLADTLSTTPGIRMKPAGLVRQAQAPDAREVGQKLQVDHVVAASLRRTPNGLRISTRLISVADGFQIWANKTDCTEAEVLEVSDTLAGGIATALSTRATAETKPTDPRAVDLYLRARAELRRFWGTHIATAATLLDEAIEIAPTSTPIVAAWAYANVQQWVMGGDRSMRIKAQAAMERGLATGHGEAYLASAQYLFNRGEWERAASDLGRAITHAPMSGQSHELAARILFEVAGISVARQHYETARGLDPGRSQIIDAELARADALDGDWASAEARVARLVADPDPPIQALGHLIKGRIAMWRGDMSSLLATGRMFARTAQQSRLYDIISRADHVGEVTEDMWRELLGEAIDPDRPRRQYLVRLQIYSELMIAIGMEELMLDGLDRVVDLGLLDLTWMDHNPLIARVRTHPRFFELHQIVRERAGRVYAAFKSAGAR